jgi:hypothetical protein
MTVFYSLTALICFIYFPLSSFCPNSLATAKDILGLSCILGTVHWVFQPSPVNCWWSSLAESLLVSGPVGTHYLIYVLFKTVYVFGNWVSSSTRGFAECERHFTGIFLDVSVVLLLKTEHISHVRHLYLCWLLVWGEICAGLLLGNIDNFMSSIHWKREQYPVRIN